MSLIAFLIMGLVVGFIARVVLPVNHRMGLLSTCILGMMGAVVGGGLFGTLFNGRAFELGPTDMVLGALGSMVFLGVVGTANSRRAHG